MSLSHPRPAFASFLLVAFGLFAACSDPTAREHCEDAGLEFCDGVCVDTARDGLNCGACGETCLAGEVCVDGSCITSCQSGLTLCEGLCRDLQTDPAHCSACGEACDPGELCSGGDCALSCQGGLTACEGICRDLQSDPGYCGDCAEACDPGELCSAGICATSCQVGLTDCDGRCRDLEADPSYCGDCARSCDPAEACVDGDCVRLLVCGPETEEIDGICVPIDTGPDCGFGTVPLGDECVAFDSQVVSLPLPAGTTTHLLQGINGSFSHDGAGDYYAIDFPLPVGSSIVAARGGRVLELKEDSDKGCGNPSCAQDGNYLIIDHGDGTQGVYGHLQKDGVLPELGDVVCRGQPIGLSGNTGYSSSPHLHFVVWDLFLRSLPFRFEEFDTSFGVPFEGVEVTSANVDPGGCVEENDFSDCPQDAFLFVGIELDPGIPCAYASHDTPYTISGRNLGADGGRVAILQFDFSEGKWKAGCEQVGPDGRFSRMIQWDAATYGDESAFMVVAADADCAPHHSWHASLRVVLGP